MLEVITPYKRYGKLFFRCSSNGVVIYLTVWQITIRDGHEKASPAGASSLPYPPLSLPSLPPLPSLQSQPQFQETH